MVPQGYHQSAANADSRHDGQTHEYLARKTCHLRSRGTQAHFAGMRRVDAMVAVIGYFRIVLRLFAHDCGLPSVRVMRTICCGSPPSLSSAAANKRSTIM